MFKLKIHSVVDVINNSSTTIYTYHDNCVKPAKEMINEFTKALGSDLTADDIFYINVFLEDEEIYINAMSQVEDDEYIHDDDYKKGQKIVSDTIAQVLEEKIKKPDWMLEAEEQQNYNGYNYESVIYIIEKDPKYKLIGKSIKKLLSSIDIEADMNG